MHDGLRLAMLTSGGATTAREIIRACNDGRLPHVMPALFITNRPEAGGVDKARAEGIPERDIRVVRRRDYETDEEFGEALLAECRARGVDFIGQYGWLPRTPANVVQAYEGRMLNQHPGPLRPDGLDFGGRGMYGRRVHCARLHFVGVTHRDPWTEVVAHRVTAEFDRGEVVKKSVVPIFPDDDTAALQARALPIEHDVQIAALADASNGRLAVVRQKPLVRRGEEGLLTAAKEIAAKMFPTG